jgi:hypothetical protein
MLVGTPCPVPILTPTPCTSALLFCLTIYCLNASIVTGRSSKPQGHYDPLALIRHGRETGQDGKWGMAKVARRQQKST